MWQVCHQVGKFCRRFSQLHWSSFDALPIERRLVDRLNDLNVKIPTEIQQKSLRSVLKGKNVIINAETGSGKTLCYLIPVLDSLFKSPRKPRGPAALVLVPNMDLGYQIAELFNTLSDPGYYACPVHRDSRLHISEQYPLIVSTPHALSQYNIASLSTIQTIIIDEADLVIASAGKSFWKLLESFKEQYPRSTKQGRTPRQFIFAAATLLQRGEKSILRKITRWLPDVVHISSSMTHQFVPTMTPVHVFMEHEEKLPQLLRHLNILRNDLPGFKGVSSLDFFAASQRGGRLRILVFTNTIAMAKNVFEFLNCQEGTTFEVLDTKTDHGVGAESHVMCRHKIYGDSMESLVSTKTKLLKRFSTKTGSMLPWKGKVDMLHKEVDMYERQEILRRFKTGEVVVLVSTDLASRGLDILDVSHVIQVDFARNATDVLHRAGRTARAGAQGTVISFVTEKDQDLLNKLNKKGPGANL